MSKVSLKLLKIIHTYKQYLPFRSFCMNHYKFKTEKTFNLSGVKRKGEFCFEEKLTKVNELYFVNQLQGFKTAASSWAKKKKLSEEMFETALIKKESMFEELEKKDKETFLATMDLYLQRSDKHRRHHVEFIYAALNRMEEFGVHRDMETYKKLLDLFPKGLMVAETFWQREFQHYPKQQQCAIDVLDQMELYGVLPDTEIREILLLTFGDWSYVVRKLYRMMYWMPKFKNTNPWPIPFDLPRDSLELARVALQRMTAVDVRTLISVYKTEDIPDNDDLNIWIASAQSPVQQKLLTQHPKNEPLYVEGPFRVWVRFKSLYYFHLRAESEHQEQPVPREDSDDVSNLLVPYLSEEQRKEKTDMSVHEQEDGTYFGVCITETSSPASLSAWIHFLQLSNPVLRDINVLFSLKYAPDDDKSLVQVDSQNQRNLERLKENVVNSKNK